MKRLLIVWAAAGLLLLSGCTPIGQAKEEGGTEKSYSRITQETAREMMSRDDGHVIVDVRRQDEYDAGHIPGAILIPNEEIGTSPPAALPDLNQIVLLYCRSGICSHLSWNMVVLSGMKTEGAIMKRHGIRINGMSVI